MQVNDELLAVVEPAPFRRWIGVAMLAGLAMLVFYVAFAKPPSIGWQGFLIAIGLAAGWTAYRLHQSCQLRIELTRHELRDSGGRVLAQVRDVASVERGAFAFKPSNGFLVTTRSPAPATWRAGLWWRLGRRIGVGGVTAKSETRAMADTLSALTQERGA